MPGTTKALKGFVRPLLQDWFKVPLKASRRSADDVLAGSRRAHRARLDDVDRAARQRNLDDIAASRGTTADQLPRTPQYRMNASQHIARHRSARNADPAEIARQRELQQHGMNTQTVRQTLDQMATNRRVPSTELRNSLRRQLFRQGRMDLRAAGYSRRDADRLARQYADNQFPSTGGRQPQQVLHNQDLNLGGRGDTYTYGDGPVNNAFGRMSRAERAAFQAWLQKQDPDAVVNVLLT